MSKIVAIASQKGGAGKTTLTLAIAGVAMAAGRTVVILDMDPQASASAWADQRGGEPAPIVDGVGAQRLQKAIDQAKALGTDLILVDTAPSTDPAALAACRVADQILIPCRPGYFDIIAIKATVDVATIAGKTPAIVINGSRPNSRQAADAIGAMAGLAADIVPSSMALRADFSDAAMVGKTITEHAPDSKAAAEAAAVAAWVFNRVGM